jgi:3-isopropylmalate/(R)-2-methylmalate dehydratase small subunit
MKNMIIETVAGTAVSLRGNDIDTDRIIPARFLKWLEFSGLGAHAFEDDRAQLKAQGRLHPFEKPEYAGAAILLVNKNFGCGSSREHAPQALHRWGIKAVAGESFGEIFAGNCVSVGVPCLRAEEEALAEMQALNEADPKARFAIDLRECTISCGDRQWKFTLPEGARRQFLEGKWDATQELLTATDRILEVASALPYISHWK